MLIKGLQSTTAPAMSGRYGILQKVGAAYKLAISAISSTDRARSIHLDARLGFSEFFSNDINSDIRTKNPYINKKQVSRANPIGTAPGNKNIRPTKSRSMSSEIEQSTVNAAVAVLPSRIFRQCRNIAGKKSGINIPPKIAIFDHKDCITDVCCSGLEKALVITNKTA